MTALTTTSILMEEVAIDEEFESEGDVESEDLEATLRSLQKLSFFLGKGLT
jgi:hypothetical protein